MSGIRGSKADSGCAKRKKKKAEEALLAKQKGSLFKHFKVQRQSPDDPDPSQEPVRAPVDDTIESLDEPPAVVPVMQNLEECSANTCIQKEVLHLNNEGLGDASIGIEEYSNTKSDLENGETNSATMDWMSCAGQLVHLTEFLEDCKSMHRKLLSDEFVNPVSFLTQIMDIATNIKEISISLLNRSHRALEELTEHTAISEPEMQYCIVDADPGKRKPIKSDNQRRYLIDLGPFQPKLLRFPVSSTISTKKQCRFSPKWYNDYPHLEYSIEKDAAFCFVCCLFPDGIGRSNADLAWTEKGVNRWDKMKSVGKDKSGKLTQHFSSTSHKAALETYAHFVAGSTGFVEVMLDKKKRSEVVSKEHSKELNRKVINILIDVARTLGRQGLAFRGNTTEDGNFMQMIMLLSRHNVLIKKWLDTAKFRPYHVTYLSAESQNEFIDLLGSAVKEKVVEEVKQAGIFSLMADTTPDVSHKDQLAVNVRFVNNCGEPKERLLQICEVKDKSGAGLARSISQVLTSNGLDIANVAFQSYDFASSMSGEFNGTQQKLSEIAERNIPYIPCQGHRINTFGEHACNSSIIIANMFATLEALFIFFSSSTKRYSLFLDKIHEVENALHLRNLSKTRWTYRAESIKAVSTSLEAIVEALTEISSTSSFDKKTKTTAFALRKDLVSLDTIVSLQFMKNVMYKLKNLTETLESPELNIIDALTIMKSCVMSITDINQDEIAMDRLINSAVVTASKFGIDAEQDFELHHRRRLQPRRYDENALTQTKFTIQSFYRQHFKLVLDTLITLTSEHLASCLKTVEPIFQLLSPPMSRAKITLETVENMIRFYPSSHPDSFALQAELEILSDQCNADMKYVSEVMKKSEAMKLVLPLANRTCRLACTSPVTVAANERSFSKLKFVKNYLKSTMTDSRMGSLLLLTTEKDLSDSLDMSVIVNRWTKLKHRRISL